jgi:hypothetical protein
VTGVELDDDRHDFTQTELTLPPAMALPAMEQMLGVDRLKALAKVIDITEHSDELAHGDLRMIAVTSWQISLPYAGPYGLARPARLSRTQVIL